MHLATKKTFSSGCLFTSRPVISPEIWHGMRFTDSLGSGLPHQWAFHASLCDQWCRPLFRPVLATLLFKTLLYCGEAKSSSQETSRAGIGSRHTCEVPLRTAFIETCMRRFQLWPTWELPARRDLGSSRRVINNPEPKHHACLTANKIIDEGWQPGSPGMDETA